VILRARPNPFSLFFDEDSQSENVEQSSPAHTAGMQYGVSVGKEALADLPRFPSVGRRVQRHIDHYRCADNILARNAAPEATVIGISAIVAHHKIAIIRNLVGSVEFIRLAEASGIRLGELLSVDPHGAIVNVDSIAG
jgi:hypothetical protein